MRSSAWYASPGRGNVTASGGRAMGDTTAARAPRYWCRREGRIRLDEQGFLLDPEGPYRHLLNPDLSRLDDLSGFDCLILLGEPGMGKSTELRASPEPNASEDILIRRDLAEYGDEGRLIRELFDGPEWGLWRAGGRTLRLE